MVATPAAATTPDDGSVLPFPPTPSASVAGPTLQESKHQRRVEPNRLPKDAPNILIVSTRNPKPLPKEDYAMTITKLIATSSLILALIGATAIAGPLNPDCTVEKAAKSTAAKATVGVGGRCSAKEAATDTAKRKAGIGGDKKDDDKALLGKDKKD